VIPSELSGFLVDLSVDPARLAAYIDDPGAAMDAAGLDRRSRNALGSGSAQNVWDVLSDRPSAHHEVASRRPDESEGAARGSLTVVGTGVSVGQLTVEAIAWIKQADAVCYLVSDPVAEEAIRRLNPRGAVSLRKHYGEGVRRERSYEAMVEHILTCVRAGLRTCAAFYGHPGVYTFPSHESIRQARQEGFEARMLPSVSAEDCLFADLGVDPAVSGCQSYEATDFLVHLRTPDTSAQLILWQVGAVGDWTYRAKAYELPAFPLLVARLREFYAPSHEVVVYEAAVLPGVAPRIARIPLGAITAADVTARSTLYVPPVCAPGINDATVSALKTE
jgi:hypothetical protein